MNLYLICAVVSTFFCISCGVGNNSKEASSSKEKHKKEWTRPHVEGHWKLINTEIVEDVPFLDIQTPDAEIGYMGREESPWDFYTEHDMVIEGNSMFLVDFPIQAFRRSSFTLDTGYMILGYGDDTVSFPIEVVNDTLYLYTKLSYNEGYFKETYVETIFDDSTLNILKKYGVNYPELAGTWYLVREDDFDYGTHYELHFPHELPDSIELSRIELIKLLDKEKTYELSTDGIKQLYSFSFQSDFIHFEPGNWFEGEEYWIHYSRNSSYRYFSDELNFQEIEEPKLEITEKMRNWHVDSSRFGDMRWSFNELNQIILSEFPEAYEEFVEIKFRKVEDNITPATASFLIPTIKLGKIDSSEIQRRLEVILFKMGVSSPCKSYEIGESQKYSWHSWQDKVVTKIHIDFAIGC